MRRLDVEQQRWLVENYGKGSIYDTLDAFESEFGWRPTKKTIYQRANRLGLRKQLQDQSIRSSKAQTRIVWSKEPEMTQWMCEHDTGSYDAIVEKFEERFGVRLSRGQVGIFRSKYGTAKRKVDRTSFSQRKNFRPVGFERKTKGGILVKVAESTTKPQSKDNWRFKHHIAYEQTWGGIPEGCTVMAVDGDTCNCDPQNLVACPKRVAGVLNEMVAHGATWSDRESLIALISVAQLHVGINDAEHRAERVCGVCGKPFVEDEDRRKYSKRIQTCPTCLAAGHKARGNRCKAK